MCVFGGGGGGCSLGQFFLLHVNTYLLNGLDVGTEMSGIFCVHLSLCLSVELNVSLHFTGELRRLRKLVVDSKKENVKVASALVNRMLEKNMFLFGAVDLKEGSMTEKIKELRAKEDATIRIAQEKYLFFPFKSYCLCGILLLF